MKLWGYGVMRLWDFESRNNQNNLNLLRFLTFQNVLSLPNNTNIQNPPKKFITEATVMPFYTNFCH